MTERRRKKSISMPADLADEVQRLVDEGRAPSFSAAMDEAAAQMLDIDLDLDQEGPA